MKKLLYTVSLVGILSFSSCNDWLNVDPQGQVEAEELYKTTQGCNSAIGGIYHTFSSSTLYGQNLSYGLLDVLAQYYDLSTKTNNKYFPLTSYNYQDQEATSSFESIWHDLYYAITQCNAFIHYSDPYKNSIGNYNLLLGEVYGLRALAHMELFEIFGPVIHTKSDLQKSAVAYRTSYNNISQPFDTGDVVLQKAADDLNRALELLADDPIRDPNVGRTGDTNNSVLDYQNVLNYRGARMNYFCALGLMARLEMLRKNPDVAYTYATRVITESKDILSLIDKSNIMGTQDSRINNYSTEMLGSFYVNNLYDMTNIMYGMGGKTTSDITSLVIDLNMYQSLLNNIYNRQPDGSGADNRYIYWFVQNADGGSNYDFTKYRQAAERQGLGYAYFPEISIMRMSEIYYIASEALIGKDNDKALQYLNDVRSTRNLTPIEGTLDNETLLEYIVRDARKDLIGEGRMFFMYKRLFYDIYARQGKIITANDKNFVVPIPDNEYEFSGIEKPENNK